MKCLKLSAWVYDIDMGYLGFLVTSLELVSHSRLGKITPTRATD